MDSKLVRAEQALATTVSGSLLVSDYRSAMTNLTTVETAKYMARQSEQATIHTIESAALGNNNVFVTPGDIPATSQETLVKSSVNAHLQKVQAEQLKSFTAEQIAQMEQEDKRKYIGKKIRITVTDSAIEPVESLWFDNKTGKYHKGIIKNKVIKGLIEDIVFAKNLLVIKPLWTSRLFLPARKDYFVYVINPDTLAPAVDISLL